MLILKWILLAASVVGLAKTDTTITLEGTQLDITRQTIDGVNVLHIEGSGMYQFTHTFGDENVKYSFNQVTTSGQDFLIEGYIIQNYQYDPFFIVINHEGELILHERFNDDLDQDILGAYPLNDGYLLHIGSSISNGQGDLEFYNDELHILGSEKSHQTFDEKITNIEAIEDGYRVYFDFNDVAEVYVRNTQTMYLGSKYEGIQTGETYTDEVTIHFAGEATLNGELIEGPYTLVHPGKYTFKFHEHLVNFSLDPKVTGIQMNAIKASDVRIDYTYGQGRLNGELYAPGEIIEGPGEYIFGIYEDNYAYEIPFKINARIDGVMHLQTYNEPITITYQGEGYLNNEYFESGSTVDEDGTYTLKVFGDHGYLEMVQFKIEMEDTLSKEDWIERSLLGGSFVLAGWFFIREFRRMRKRSATP